MSAAGGGLAAALALLARDRGEVPVQFQLLDCPMLDDRQHTWSSRLDGLEVWNKSANELGWRSYLGELYGRADVPYYAAPARATDLSGLPPVFVSVGGVDGFLAEDVDYAVRLMQAGVPTELHVYPGAPHGYALSTGFGCGTAEPSRHRRLAARQIPRMDRHDPGHREIASRARRARGKMQQSLSRSRRTLTGSSLTIASLFGATARRPVR